MASGKNIPYDTFNFQGYEVTLEYGRSRSIN